jgi:hypothetical protein
MGGGGGKPRKGGRPETGRERFRVGRFTVNGCGKRGVLTGG